jgi:hypothetical protein
MDKEWEGLTFEAWTWKWLDHIEEVTKDSLTYEKLASTDRKILEKGLKHLRPAVEELSKWFIEPLREKTPSRTDYGYEKLCGILGWAFAMGSKADLPDSAMSAIMAEIAKGKRPPNPIDKKIMNELLKKTPRNLIAKRLKQPDNNAFKQRVSRVRKKLPKIS